MNVSSHSTLIPNSDVAASSPSNLKAPRHVPHKHQYTHTSVSNEFVVLSDRLAFHPLKFTFTISDFLPMKQSVKTFTILHLTFYDDVATVVATSFYLSRAISYVFTFPISNKDIAEREVTFRGKEQ
jgi:hypothetical protein